ncbi:MAG: hypothetical protein ACHQ49_08670 [Elusimicrobiota bacterium]
MGRARWTTTAYWAIFAAAAAERLAFLREPARNDEIWSLLHFAPRPLSEILGDYSTVGNHMLFSLLLHFSWEAFGLSKLAMRLPALAAGLAAVALTERLAREAADDDRVSLLAMAFAAFAWPMVHYSVNGRGYSLQTAFALCLALSALARGLDGRPRARFAFAWLSAAATLFTIPTGVVAVLPAALWAAVVGVRERRPRWLAAAAACAAATGLACLAFYSAVLPELFGMLRPAGAAGPVPAWPTLGEAARIASDGFLPAIVFWPLVIFGLASLAAERPGRAALYAGLSLAAYPLATSLGLRRLFPLMYARNYSPLYPFAYVAAAAGIWALVDRARAGGARRAASLAAVLALAASSAVQAAVLFADRARLYFPERPMAAAGERLIPAAARSFERGETMVGAGIVEDATVAYYVTTERGFKGFYSLYALNARGIRTVVLFCRTQAEAAALRADLPGAWSEPRLVAGAAPMSLYSLTRRLP